MKKVAIIGTVGIPSKYGGFETLSDNLVRNLSEDFEFTVYCSTKAYSRSERVRNYQGARLVFLPLNANGIQSILYDIISMIHALFYADTLLVLGVSGGIFVPVIRLFTRKKVIINIDGLEWRRQKWGKWIKKFLKFSERVAVKWSHADITDNFAIKRYTSINYKSLSHLIEYGADHVSAVPISRVSRKKYTFLQETYAFKVARIEPENNIKLILDAFKEVNQNLVVVGNWNASQYGVNLRKEYGRISNIFLLDPIYDQQELDEIRSNCFLYVHGHSAGGTNPSLVEAMYLGLPVLAFDCSYNRATMDNHGMYFKNKDAIVKVLNNISVSHLLDQGNQLFKIASSRYTWKEISSKYANLINAFDYQYVKREVLSHWTRVNEKELLVNEMAHLKRPLNYYD